MKKIIILAVLMVIAIQSNAQTRYGSCKSKSQSRLYITPYIGAGGGLYSYDLNKTVVGPAPDSLVYDNSKGVLYTPVVGLNIMYSIGNANIGGGLEWQGAYGSTSTDVSSQDHNIYFYKFYGRFEYALYTDAFSDFGFNFQGGLSFPNNIVGTSNDMGMFLSAGLFYNLIINSTSSIIIGADYEYSAFTSTIGNRVSNHIYQPIKLTIGYRFWF
ncbi:MAG: hypothetical protein B6I18_01875 [Bacteroidetes bacterium 4572_112]|nr:MAG: hypothetical protein B6I18_01875 [Bacteroidetes bacterium 4572_112]